MDDDEDSIFEMFFWLFVLEDDQPGWNVAKIFTLLCIIAGLIYLLVRT